MSRIHLPSHAILALLLAFTAASPALAHPNVQEDRARAVSSRLIAPCCYQQTLDVHESELATALRAEIASRLRAGESPAQVEDSLVERYGERVRAVPRDHDTRAHVLVLLGRLPMTAAVGTSLLVIAVNSAVGLLARIGTTSIEWGITLPFTVAAIAGVLTGGQIAGRLDATRSLRWFAGLLVAVAIYTAGDVVIG